MEIYAIAAKEFISYIDTDETNTGAQSKTTSLNNHTLIAIPKYYGYKKYPHYDVISRGICYKYCLSK